MPEPKTNEQLLQFYQQQIDEAFADIQAAKADKVNGPARAITAGEQAKAAVAAINALRGEQNLQKPAVVNLGDGTLAFVDPTQVTTPGYTPTTFSVPKPGTTHAINGYLVTPAPSGQSGPPTIVDTMAPEDRQLARDKTTTDIAGTQATTAHTQATTASLDTRTPAAKFQDELTKISATASAHAQAAITAAHAAIASGDKLSERESKLLDEKLKEIADDRAAAIQTARDAAIFERDRPFKERAAATTEAGQKSLEQQRVDNAAYQQEQVDRQNREQQIGVLTDQSKQGQGLVNQALTAGVVPSATATRQAYNPLRYAFSLAQSSVANGKLPPTAMPTPQAPLPPGVPQGPGAPSPLEAPEPVAA